MRKIFPSILAFALAFLTLNVTVVAQSKAKGKTKKARPITVVMTGGAEVPGPGDPDGRGTAKITLDEAKGEVCYELRVSKIQTATAAHIHQGAAGQAGDVKVGLDAPASGMSKGCKPVDAALIKDIMTNPKNYYVNVHNAEFQNGAIRGQLGK
jgi:hypothetical protein